MGQSLDGLGNLLQMPYGCGEQNMLHFAPDVYILKYFDATGRTNGSVVEKAKRFINEGIVDSAANDPPVLGISVFAVETS